MDNIKVKGLLEFIAEDESLAKKITCVEFENKEAAPNNSDDGIQEAFEAYRAILEGQ